MTTVNARKVFCSGPCGRAKLVPIGKIEKCPDCSGVYNAAWGDEKDED